eukprot:CAMPEP_0184698048 /NCGR_PEP_ID=MMETSP0313-20130426/4803_1 /TAXON_ID=2792 /ORGANISM="Porphyridium aerugineum, Strain SAG 1380-2" /LENGTH=38 /DNA_ID= /DNA_START= /DNA_END= /DNA_ORIENTATION=
MWLGLTDFDRRTKKGEDWRDLLKNQNHRPFLPLWWYGK